MRDAIMQALKIGMVVMVVAGLAMGGIALAQTGDDDTTTTTEVPSLQDDGSDEATTEDEDRDFRGRGFRHHLHGLEAVEELTGLSAEEIAEQLRDGSTLAEIAEANGSSAEALVAALVAQAEERLDEAVAEGRITQEEADEKLAEAEERITALVDGEISLRDGFKRGPRAFFGDQAEEVAALLGMTTEELAEARADGQTLAEVAEAQGVAVEDVVAVLVAPIAERLDEAVAGGDLTQEEADEKLAEAEERITQHVEEGTCAGPGGRFGRRGPGHRGFGPGGPGFGPGGDDTVEDVDAVFSA